MWPGHIGRLGVARFRVFFFDFMDAITIIVLWFWLGLITGEYEGIVVMSKRAEEKLSIKRADVNHLTNFVIDLHFEKRILRRAST